MKSIRQQLLAGLFFVSAMLSARASSFYLKPGDQVVFYGDSITDQRLYTTFTESYVLTRFPKMGVTFVHSGWGGDRVTGGGGGGIDLRLERDVFPYHPTVITIMLGMNDASYRPYDEKIFDVYRRGYEHIIASLKEHLPDARITLIQPSPFDDVTQPVRFEGGYNSVLVRYAEFVKQLAEREHLDLANLNDPLVHALERAKAIDSELAKKIIPDRVHPGPAGHLLMAGELLKAWDAPATVTAVEIDATKPGATTEERTKVSNLQKSDGGLTWSQLDASLPMPIDPNDPLVALVLKSADFVQALDQETLKVTGLSDAAYQLSIDGNAIGTFKKEDLADGINLAVLDTPMLKQAMEVHQLTLQHNNIHFARWRQVQVPFAKDETEQVRQATQELMHALDEKESEMINRQYAAAQPVAHHYELKPQR